MIKRHIVGVIRTLQGISFAVILTFVLCGIFKPEVPIILFQALFGILLFNFAFYMAYQVKMVERKREEVT